jgi:hypothetical protein
MTVPTPSTHGPGFSVANALQSSNVADRSRGFELLVVVSWKPVYKYLRRRWGKSSDDAKALTLRFFSRVMKADFLTRYVPARERFRAFVREEIDLFASTREDAASEPESLALDFGSAEEEYAMDPEDLNQPAEAFFDDEWARSLLTLAIEQLHNTLESEGKLAQFRLFQRYDLQDRSGGETMTYDELAREFSLPVEEVRHGLAGVRQQLSSIVLSLIRSFSTTDDDFRKEARSLFGI